VQLTKISFPKGAKFTIQDGAALTFGGDADAVDAMTLSTASCSPSEGAGNTDDDGM
jgi:hypothetical protein